jgi:Zn finger protein HypA/HybF involved in hydrogenase expression
MKQTFDAETLDGGVIHSAHEIEILCQHCGYDLDEHELAMDTCSDCGTSLELKQNIAISVTSVPIFGDTM